MASPGPSGSKRLASSCLSFLTLHQQSVYTSMRDWSGTPGKHAGVAAFLLWGTAQRQRMNNLFTLQRSWEQRMASRNMSGASLGDGRYELREPIATGGMATVYKAWDTRVERIV